MTYQWKKMPELVWFAAIAASTFALAILVDFDPDTIQDWRAWATGLGAGSLRAGAGAAMAYLARR